MNEGRKEGRNESLDRLLYSESPSGSCAEAQTTSPITAARLPK